MDRAPANISDSKKGKAKAVPGLAEGPSMPEALPQDTAIEPEMQSNHAESSGEIQVAIWTPSATHSDAYACPRIKASAQETLPPEESVISMPLPDERAEEPKMHSRHSERLGVKQRKSQSPTLVIKLSRSLPRA